MFLAKSTEFLKDFGNLPKMPCSSCGTEVEQRYTTRWAIDVCSECNRKVAEKVKAIMDNMVNDKGYIV